MRFLFWHYRTFFSFLQHALCREADMAGLHSRVTHMSAVLLCRLRGSSRADLVCYGIRGISRADLVGFVNYLRG